MKTPITYPRTGASLSPRAYLTQRTAPYLAHCTAQQTVRAREIASLPEPLWYLAACGLAY